MSAARRTRLLVVAIKARKTMATLAEIIVLKPATA